MYHYHMLNNTGKSKRLGRKHRQVGFTLVELMVAMIIGLLLIAGAGGIYVAARSLSRTQDSNSIMQDYGTYTMNQLTRGIQRAGYVDWSITPSGAINFEHTDAASKDPFGSIYPNVAGNTNALSSTTSIWGCDNATPTAGGYTCAPAAANGFSGLSVAFEATRAIDGDLGYRDCNGIPSTTVIPPGLRPTITNRYYVLTDTTAESPKLMCAGFSGVTLSTIAQPIASNITQFNVLYSLLTPATPTVPEQRRWVNATTVTAANAWHQVTAVQICLGLQGAPGSAGSHTATDCTGASATYTGRLNRFFRSTVTLRNAVYSTKPLP